MGAVWQRLNNVPKFIENYLVGNKKETFAGKQAQLTKTNKTKQIGISVKCYTMNNFGVPICKLNALRF